MKNNQDWISKICVFCLYNYKKKLQFCWKILQSAKKYCSYSTN